MKISPLRNCYALLEFEILAPVFKKVYVSSGIKRSMSKKGLVPLSVHTRNLANFSVKCLNFFLLLSLLQMNSGMRYHIRTINYNNTENK
jgi:hypothetical protein